MTAFPANVRCWCFEITVYCYRFETGLFLNDRFGMRGFLEMTIFGRDVFWKWPFWDGSFFEMTVL